MAFTPTIVTPCYIDIDPCVIVTHPWNYISLHFLFFIHFFYTLYCEPMLIPHNILHILYLPPSNEHSVFPLKFRYTVHFFIVLFIFFIVVYSIADLCNICFHFLFNFLSLCLCYAPSHIHAESVYVKIVLGNKPDSDSYKTNCCIVPTSFHSFGLH